MMSNGFSFGCREFITFLLFKFISFLLLFLHYFGFLLCGSAFLRISLLVFAKPGTLSCSSESRPGNVTSKYVNFRNQILFTEGVQADRRDPGPGNCGSWIIYKLLMSFALWLDKLPSVFRHLENYFSTFFLFTT